MNEHNEPISVSGFNSTTYSRLVSTYGIEVAGHIALHSWHIGGDINYLACDQNLSGKYEKGEIRDFFNTVDNYFGKFSLKQKALSILGAFAEDIGMDLEARDYRLVARFLTMNPLFDALEPHLDPLDQVIFKKCRAYAAKCSDKEMAEMMVKAKEAKFNAGLIVSENVIGTMKTTDKQIKAALKTYIYPHVPKKRVKKDITTDDSTADKKHKSVASSRLNRRTCVVEMAVAA